jgi:hypothetical protein
VRSRQHAGVTDEEGRSSGTCAGIERQERAVDAAGLADEGRRRALRSHSARTLASSACVHAQQRAMNTCNKQQQWYPQHRADQQQRAGHKHVDLPNVASTHTRTLTTHRFRLSARKLAHSTNGIARRRHTSHAIARHAAVIAPVRVGVDGRAALCAEPRVRCAPLPLERRLRVSPSTTQSDERARARAHAPDRVRDRRA